MKYSDERMARAQRYVDRAVKWVMRNGGNASPIIDQGNPDQGDALSWRIRSDGEKYWFRTIDVKEAQQWTDRDPPESWGGFMLAKEGQLHASWVYMVINEPMTRMAVIDMEKYSASILAQEIETRHPEGGTQISMLMPYNCFTFYDLE